MLKANFNFRGSLIVAILSGGEFHSFIVVGRNEYLFVTVFAGEDGIGCFVIEMLSATQNWLKIFDGLKAKCLLMAL